jgi:hypothetical protein
MLDDLVESAPSRRQAERLAEELHTERWSQSYHETNGDVQAFEAGQAISAPVLTDAIKRLKLLIAKTPLSVTQPTGAGR